VILYEMLAGQFPFEGTSILTMLTAISRGDPKPLTQCAPDVPEDVAQLVMRMIAREKENRPESCEAIAKEIAAIETRLISDS
jgi:serine/threonine protein kinase